MSVAGKLLIVVLLGTGCVRADVVPEKLFSCSFDGTVVPEIHGGNAASVARSRNAVFVPGLRGQALEMKRGCTSALGYDVAGNLNLRAGTVAFWFRPDSAAQAQGGAQERRFFLCTPTAKPRAGSGTLWFWQYGERLRCDQSDDADTYVMATRAVKPGTWNHIAFTWGPNGTGIFLNGRPTAQIRDSGSPLRTAMMTKGKGGIAFSRRRDFGTFYVGGNAGSAFMDGAMDDLEIWSQPLDETRIAALYHAAGGTDVADDVPDYAARFAHDDPDRFVAPAGPAGGVPGPRELVARWTLDAIPSDTNRFNAIGALRLGACAGTRYLEAGTNANDRFALRFDLGAEPRPLYCFEIDYPDDGRRTMDLLVQNAAQTKWDGSEGADYILQVGVMAGDEYRSTGKILTHRCLYWPRTRDVALLAMTARAGEPAAVSEVRVYRLTPGTLPAAAVRMPPVDAAGWNRSFALYYEDPAIGYDFDVVGIGEDSVGALIDRTVALMKYTGQNLLCYPGAWYSGVIGETYMPRQHPPAYRTAWYAKFDRAGLGFIPTINQNNMSVPPGLVTYAKMENGALHDSCVSIWDTGKPNPGGWHGTPPNFNIAHPDVQNALMREVETFVAEGRDHPSFRGVVLHLTRHCLCWFGDIRAGYNDYCIDAFARARGIAIPVALDRTAPLRGAAYAKWLQSDPALYEQWLDWRCDVVAAFYRKIACRLKAARPDLKLVINTFLLPDVHHPDFPLTTFIPEANRRAGLDPRKLSDLDNVAICQTEIPADYRFFGPKPGRWGAEAGAAEPAHRILYTRPGDFGLLDTAIFPWVNQHDRYFESACGAVGGSRGKGQPTLSCPWLKECAWRVTTLNPAGRNALRAYAVPLREHDVLVYSKGGFLIGTYGTEDVVVPWMQAFRALPAVKMDEVGRAGEVVVRQANFSGKSYFYVVNTGLYDVRVNLRFPAGTEDLVTGERSAESVTLPLRAYELRAYAAPAGRPALMGK